MSHPAASAADRASDRADLEARIRALGPWFHNLTIRGVQTAPDHFLGDYPSLKWRQFAHAIPADLTGRTVLDIGCNAGFYSLEMKRRGADARRRHRLGRGATWRRRGSPRTPRAPTSSSGSCRSTTWRRSSERFDIVLFMGVLYHLRHPLLALDLLYEHVVGDLLVFQSMLRGSAGEVEVAPDYPFAEERIFDDPAFPRLHFIERKYSGDPTNWWVPNRRAIARRCCAAPASSITDHPGSRGVHLPPRRAARARRRGVSRARRTGAWLKR